MNVDEITSQWMQRFRRGLRRWYDQNARDLPWRRTRDPYRIWISEIMLQQTTVAAVIPYFHRFMERFPDVRQLAAAEEEEVLRLWEGLGYYSRARNIHKTGKIVSAERHGIFPDDVNELQTLPGIGRYTAGAITSFAFDTRAPIVEANTLRLYCRLLGYERDPRSNDGQKVLWNFAERLLPRKDVGAFNQSLMELGATLCRPTDPDCDACPIRNCCEAFATGRQSVIPLPKQKPQITEVTEVSVAVKHNQRFLLRRRPEGERWAGLWDFIRFEIDNGSATSVVFPKRGSENRSPFREDLNLRAQLGGRVTELTGLNVDIGNAITEIRHSVTRYRIRLLCFTADRVSGRLPRNGGFQWTRPDDFEQLPLSVTGRKLARLLTDRIS